MDTELNYIDVLSKIYKHIALNVHPDHGGSISDMQELNRAYEFMRLKLVNGASTCIVQFDFPYPNVEFRSGDFVKVTKNTESYIAEIDSITQIEDKYHFVLKIGDKKKTVFRSTLKCSEDQNFYLYRSRWDE